MYSPEPGDCQKGVGKGLVSIAVEESRSAWVMLLSTWSLGTYTGREMVLMERNSIASDPAAYAYARDGCYEDIEQCFDRRQTSVSQ